MHLNKLKLLLCLAPYVFSFAFALDIYIPAVPEVQVALHTSPFLIQMTLSLFLFTLTIGNIFVGPLSDQFGRVKISMASTGLFILGAMGSALASNIEFLIIARIVCALGACGMLVTPFAMIRDLFDGEENSQMYSWLNTAISVSPTFAPIVGGYLAYYLGWRSVFWFLVAMGLFILVMAPIVIKETLSVERRKKIDRQIFRRYLTILQNKLFLNNALSVGFAVAIMFSFFSISPFILMNLLHVSVRDFGWYFAVFGLTIGLGGYFAGYLIGRIGSERTIKVSISLMIIGGTSMFLLDALIGLQAASFLITMFMSCLGGMLLLGAATGRALEPFGDIAGTAASCLQAIQFLIAAIVGSVLLHFPVTSSKSYAITILLCGTAIWYLNRTSHE